MKIIFNNILPLGKRYAAINLFGVLFVKRGVMIYPELINHEQIHSAQIKEMLYLPFYIAYVIEWLIRLPLNGFSLYRAYLKISFEREAYENDHNLNYLNERRLFAQWRKKGRTKRGASRK